MYFPKIGLGIYYDPIYGYIQFDPKIRLAIDLPEMQRLRRLKQLSTVYLVYPGANHTRFEHSIGVYYLATRIFDILFSKYITEEHQSEWPILEPIHKITFQLAALFHDVGHGPYCHVFELFCKRNSKYREWRHKHMTKKLITEGVGNYQNIPKYINYLTKSFSEKVDTSFLTPKNIAAIAIGEAPTNPSYLFLSNIMSSSFDIDRMDYLRRDAYYTGIEIGTTDIWEILHNFTLKDIGSGVFKAVLPESVVEAAEIFLETRDLAYRKVYYHPVNRAAQEMIVRALQKLLMQDKEKEFDISELAMCSDYELYEKFKSSDKEFGNIFTRDVAERLKNRHIHKPLPITINKWGNFDQSAKNTIANYKMMKCIEWQKYEITLSNKLGLPSETQILFDFEDCPLNKPNDYTEKIFLTKNGELKTILELSPHLRRSFGIIKTEDGKTINFREDYIERLTKYYIYLPNEYLLQLAQKFKKDPKEVLSHLNEIIDFYIDFCKIQDEDKIKKIKEDFKNANELYFSSLSSKLI